MAEYATNAKANAGLVTGIIGTSLGAIANAGGLMGILGTKPGNQGGNSEDRPVTRYELGLIREITELKAQQYTDMRANGIQQQISQQSVWNATQEGLIRSQQQQLLQLYSLTKLMVPAVNIAPMPILETPPAVSSNGTATTGTGT